MRCRRGAGGAPAGGKRPRRRSLIPNETGPVSFGTSDDVPWAGGAGGRAARVSPAAAPRGSVDGSAQPDVCRTDYQLNTIP
eukprot:3933854-Prymnesium_polylepis.1